MREMLRRTLEEEYGAIGRRAMLPLTDLQDGRWLLRFVAKPAPPLVNQEGLELIVQPAVGSVVRIDAELQPTRSHVGIIPIMRRVIVRQFVPTAVTSNRACWDS